MACCSVVSCQDFLAWGAMVEAGGLGRSRFWEPARSIIKPHDHETLTTRGVLKLGSSSVVGSCLILIQNQGLQWVPNSGHLSRSPKLLSRDLSSQKTSPRRPELPGPRVSREILSWDLRFPRRKKSPRISDFLGPCVSQERVSPRRVGLLGEIFSPEVLSPRRLAEVEFW